MRLLHGPDDALRALGGAELTDAQILDLYPWPEGRWTRAMMVTTLDGAAAGPDGLSGSISSGSDRQVFTAVRRLADAVLVGAGTLRAERYGPMPVVDEGETDRGDGAESAESEDRSGDGAAARRRERGKRPAPVLAVVSGSLDLPWEEPVFAESAETVLVITGTTADADARALARRHCGLVELDTETVGAADALDALADRGLRHVVCEGGPSLLEGLVADGLLDEADITLSPRFAGTARTPRTHGLADVAGLRLAHVLMADDGFLMNRYLREAPAPNGREDRDARTAAQ